MPRSVPQTKVRSTGPPAFPARATASRARRFFTRHESRDTNHGFYASPAVRHFFWSERGLNQWFSRDTNHESRLFCFPVHDCSPLFTIVRHCSAKKCSAPLSSRHPVAAFLRVVERHGRLWRGMGGRRPPHRQQGRKGFSKHETRDTGFFRHVSRLFPKHALYGRSIRRGCARDAQPETAARTTAPAAWPACLTTRRGEVRERAVRTRGSRAEEKGASRLARAGVLEQYVEHGKQAQRSPGARIACFDRRVAGKAGYSLLACALWSGCGAAVVERHGAAWSGILPLNQCPRSVRRSRSASRRTPKEPMLRKRNVLYCVDTKAVSVAGVLPSEYNGPTVAMRGMCI